MKKIILSILLIFFAVNVFAQDNVQPFQFRTVQQNSFKQGEKLKYEINYGFVTAGEAIMEISPNLGSINGRPVYDISVVVNSTSSFDWVYQVRDLYKTYIDREGLFPWRFEQHIREGNYKRDFEALFDQENLKVKAYTGDTDPKKFEGEYDIPRYVQDAVSALYLSRTWDYTKMNKYDIVKLENFYKDKVYPLDVKYLGKEIIEVPAGEFRCIVVQPLVVEGGLFKSEGDLYVWMTDDELKIPVRVKSKIVIGYIDVDLTEYSGLAGTLRAKVD
jgi:hypothetical protein